ncbi:MAG: aldehyde ferredoxin oxidoreductase family protein [Promethearchaeota archaeon]
MKGWNGKILRVNLSNKSHTSETFEEDFAKKWLGGRGFALKILWDELEPGIDPLGPENKLIIALGPISGITAPNMGKVVVAAKSPLTEGYGDGNLGSQIATQLRKAGYDALVVEGVSNEPVCLYIEDKEVNFLPVKEWWGKGTYETIEYIQEKFGKNAAHLLIGQAGENLVRYAVIRSMEGRAGGRTGIGAVMGSKKLKAIVVKGTKHLSDIIADPEKMKELGSQGMQKVKELDEKNQWTDQSTNAILSWCNDFDALPVKNFRKTSHPLSHQIDGVALSKARVKTYGCPICVMKCGIAIRDDEDHISELDYENIGMLGANLEIFDLQAVGTLNYLCDDYGVDTISAGSVLGFYADVIEQGLFAGEFKFGDSKAAKILIKKIAYREDIGDFLAEGVKRMSEKIGNNSQEFAMHVKGLEISAYNCKFCPGMALAFGTAGIGAHHKEAWVIMFELTEMERDSYDSKKAKKVIELQRIRGGLFEGIVSCRFPWIEEGFELDHYLDYFKATTGINFTFDDFWEIADRYYAMMRAFFVREFADVWNRRMDHPPTLWFKDPIPNGKLAGKLLDLQKYDELLSAYYELRGWDERGIPKISILEKLGMDDVLEELSKYIELVS